MATEAQRHSGIVPDSTRFLADQHSKSERPRDELSKRHADRHPPLKVNWSWGGLIHGPVDPRFNRYRNYTVSHGTATSCLSGPHVVGLAPPPVNPTAVDTEGGGVVVGDVELGRGTAVKVFKPKKFWLVGSAVEGRFKWLYVFPAHSILSTGVLAVSRPHTQTRVVLGPPTPTMVPTTA